MGQARGSEACGPVAHDPADAPRRLIESCTQDHRSNILSSRRLEKISTTTSTVTHVITHQIGNDCRVAWIIFRDAGLNLANEISAYISSLRINTATQLRKERNKARTKAKAHSLRFEVMR